ncbi:MAG: 50S ribosomal protein L25 [Candidatus Omnitrophica bacterium]|nr:50S ribosomal protein L25 [Candidatus Omnitrophota bacterium]MCG2702828.1 50S ribosomal protein L25 [Candidatus Omnitrophota bacterium]
MERVALNAQIRKESGKSIAGKLRRRGLIPAVIYGKNEEPMAIATDRREIVKLLRKQGENVIIDLNVQKDANTVATTVIIKDIQYNILKEEISHIDFQHVKLTEKIRVYVPLTTKGGAAAPGVKEGGVLEHILREIEIEALPTNIPKEIVIDVSGLKIGDAVHVADLKVGEGIEIITDVSQIAVLVKFTAEEKVETVEKTEEETIEPEVIKKKKAEEEPAEEKK